MDASLLLESILEAYGTTLGRDREAYGNHVRRVYHTCVERDPAHAVLYALAAAFHDIGIWTAGSFDYLEPSVAEAERYLQEHGYDEHTEAIRLMIRLHHKVRAYRGPHQELVQVFRQADWMDVSLGWRRFGISKSWYRQLRKRFPGSGFHTFLLRQTFRQLWRQPLRPFPMFRW